MNDNSTAKRTHPDLSDNGLGDDLRSFLAEPAKPARTRNLRPTFRATPSTGFPGTTAFQAHRLDSRANGSDRGAARVRPVGQSADTQGSDPAPGRRTALQQAGSGSSTVGTAIPADTGAATGKVRGRGSEGARTAGEARSSTAGRRGRPPGSGKKGQPVENKPLPLPAAIKKLVGISDATPAAPKIIPTEEQRADARRLFREIGQKFNENRKKSKTAAYAGYRHDLMDNMDVLIMGGAIDLKEVTSVITGLEQYTKETEAESTETPATILGRWLRMDAAEIASLVVASDEAVEELEVEGEIEPELEEDESLVEELETNQEGQQSM